jgi:predicted Ser/Thr protein kinase
MFRNDHVRQLRPKSWAQQVIGKGGHGKVYRATWQGREVAVKRINLPAQADRDTAEARQALKEKVMYVVDDFSGFARISGKW